MSAPVEEGDGLSRLSGTELAHAYVTSVEAAEGTEHIGRQNRLARRRSNIVDALKARGEARQVLERLAQHSNEQVRANAKGALDWLDKPAQEFAPEPLREPQILWQCDHPPPAPLTRDEIAERLRRSVPASRDRLMDLALPAIGLWPQRRADIPAVASRFGGTPLAPPDWEWPTFEDEPMLFVGQIDCAELRGLPAAELLPPHGVLAFFGDHDAVQGGDSLGMSAVYHWPDADRLVAAQPPIEPILIFPACAVAPRPIFDLPHPFSTAVSKLQFGKEERDAYFDVWLEIREHGIPRECVRYAGFSKLLGWPDLLQNDLWRFESQDDARLLLQVDSYCNGETLHGWGTGGNLYYLLPECDLRARFYDNCDFEGQFT